MKRLITTFALVAALAGVGCAGKVSRVVVQADTASVNQLLEVKNAKDVRCDAGEIPASSCVALAQAYVPVWDAYLATNAAIQAQKPLNEVDKLIANYKTAAIGFKDAVQNIQGDARQILLDLIEQAIKKFDH